MTPLPLSGLHRLLGRARRKLLLDGHRYANVEFDGAANDIWVVESRLRLMARGWWLGWMHGDVLDSIETLCLFVGYPRSGHSLLGSLIDAHPHAAIAHEFNAIGLIARGGASSRPLEALLLHQSLRGSEHGRLWTAGHDYTMQGAYQGVVKPPLLVVGDKKGGAAASLLARQPTILIDLKRLFGDRLKFIIHTRNPFDIVATMAIRAGHSSVPPELVADFRVRTAGVEVVRGSMDASTVFFGRHRDLLDRPRGFVADTVRFLGLDPEPDHLEACVALIDPTLHKSRSEVSWPPGLRESLQAVIDQHDFLRGYDFED